MAAQTSAELVIFDCSEHEGGLDEFFPEADPHVARAPSRSWPLVVPVVIAAAIAGGVLSWAGVGAGARPVPSVSRAAPAVASASADEVAPRALAPAAEIAPPVTRAETAAPPMAAPPPIDPAVERTLAAVSQSYRSLDATSLIGVWPGADTASLAERFSALKYQSLTFDRCQVKPNGPAGALASCEVSIAAAPKVGEPSLQRHRESWTLVMDRSGDRWTIAGVSVR